MVFKIRSTLADERKFKEDPRDEMLRRLGREAMHTLMSSRSYEEIWNRARNVINMTALISHYEKRWLKNGVDSHGRHQLFSVALADLLYGEAALPIRFDSFAQMLYKIGAAKWPIATYFPFLAFPDTQIFLKPEVTKFAAKVCKVDIGM